MSEPNPTAGHHRAAPPSPGSSPKTPSTSHDCASTAEKRDVYDTFAQASDRSLAQVATASLNPAYGDPVLSLFVTISLRRIVLVAACATLISLVPIALAWKEGTLANEDLKPDLLRDYPYWCLGVAGVPLAIYAIGMFLGALPHAIGLMVSSGILVMTYDDLNKFSKCSQAVYTHWIVRYVPIIVACELTMLAGYLYVLSPQNSWHSPDGQYWGTVAGWVACCPTFVAYYLLSTGVFRIGATYQVLSQLLRRYPARVQLFHPDRCGGWLPLGQACIRVNMIVAVFGVISVGGILGNQNFDYSLIHPANMAIIVGYILGATIVVYLPLRVMHKRMARVRYDALGIVGNQADKLKDTALTELSESKTVSEETAKRLTRLAEVRTVLAATPVYPVNLRALSSISGTILVPIAVFVITEWLKWFFEAGGLLPQ